MQQPPNTNWHKKANKEWSDKYHRGTFKPRDHSKHSKKKKSK